MRKINARPTIGIVIVDCIQFRIGSSYVHRLLVNWSPIISRLQ